MKSVVHEIPGLPFDHKSGKRVFLFTAWTRDAIKHAEQKVRLRSRQYLYIQRHFGMDGYSGPEWWSFTACLDVDWVHTFRCEPMPPRYGMERAVWTRASETLDRT